LAIKRATVVCFYMTTHSSLTYRALASGHSPSFSTQPGTGHPSSNLRGAVLASRSNSRGANKRPARQPSGGLIATVTNSKIRSCASKQTALQISNRNKNAHPTRLDLRVRRGGIAVLSQPQAEEPKDLSWIGIQLQASSVQHPDSNRSWYRLEFNISPTKQRTEVLSNRSNSGVFRLAAPSISAPPASPLNLQLLTFNLPMANKRLMETHANSKFALTNWNHTHLTNPNRNNKSHFYFHQPHSSIQPQASGVQPPDSNRQLETIRNGHNPFINMQMTFSNRPKKTEVKNSPSFALRRPSALVARRIHGVNQGCGDLGVDGTG
jgi:hypothetical protein